MKYPECYRYWIEAEISAGTWSTELPLRAGCSNLEEVHERLIELQGLAERWKSIRYRVVDPAGVEVEASPAFCGASAPSAV